MVFGGGSGQSVNLCLTPGQQACVRSPVWRISHLLPSKHTQNWSAGGWRRQTDSHVDAVLRQGRNKSTHNSDCVSISETAPTRSQESHYIVNFVSTLPPILALCFCYQLSALSVSSSQFHLSQVQMFLVSPVKKKSLFSLSPTLSKAFLAVSTSVFSFCIQPWYRCSRVLSLISIIVS